MCVFKAIFCIAAAMSAVTTANATIIVNVDSIANASLNGSNAVRIALAAGTYKLSFIQDTYTAFTRSRARSGCDAAGKNCFTGFENSVKYVVNGTIFSLGDRGANGGLGAIPGSSSYYENAQISFANSSAFSSLFTLTSPEPVHFYIFDDFLSDNSGGVSLALTSVPEPANWILMIVGFGLVGGLARHRKEKRALMLA